MDQYVNHVGHLNKEKRGNYKEKQIYQEIINNPHMIEYIPQTADYCMLALVLDYTCFSKIKNPTWVMKKFVTERINLQTQFNDKSTGIIFEI